MQYIILIFTTYPSIQIYFYYGSYSEITNNKPAVSYIWWYLSLNFYIHRYKPLTLYPRRDSRGISDITPWTPTFYQYYFALSNTADVTGGKPTAVWSQVCYQSFSHLLRHPWKKEWGAIFLFCPGHHTRPHPTLNFCNSKIFRLFMGSVPDINRAVITK
jgi:hypothetical protein